MIIGHRPSPSKDDQIRGLERQLATAETRIAELTAFQLLAVEALQWCSGSADFAPEGQAHEGWVRLCRPLLRDDLVAAVNTACGLLNPGVEA